MKRRIRISMLLLLGLAAAAPVSAMAYTVPETVRVGLESVCKNAPAASIGAGEVLIGMEEDGAFVERETIESDSSFTVCVAADAYIALEEEMDCGDALDLAEELREEDYDAYAAYLGGRDWTIYVAGSSLADVEEETDASVFRVKNFTGFVLSGDDIPVILPENAVLMGTGKADTINLNGKRYRGMLTFAINDSSLTAVNIVGLEEYLYGVVPAEMPQSYEKEALKAQAVAARTYAMTKLGAHTGSGYQLCDTTACQVYNGYSGEADSTTEAVDATAGEIACYDGKPIEAVFSASSGGYTENSENVWYAAVPYLRAVPEIAEYGDNTWTKTLTLQELEELIEKKGENIGRVEDIVITKLSTGGRVQEMQIVGSRGEKTLTKEEIRTYFSSACGSLPGKMFTINGKGGEIGVYGEAEPIKQTAAAKSGTLLAAAQSKGIIVKAEGDLSSLDGKKLMVDVVQERGQTAVSTKNGEYEVYSVSISTISGNRFVFEGIGMGHGVGLSQKGAQAMAQMGYSYEEILHHYYTDITIED